MFNGGGRENRMENDKENSDGIRIAIFISISFAWGEHLLGE
jgi:hypothetical protein